MLGNFTYYNPTKLYFGENAIEGLEAEMKKYGKKIMLSYGGGSVKKNGAYDDVMKVLNKLGKEVVEDPGVMSNPTYERLLKGIDLAKKEGVEFILALGGGSVIDYSKTVAAAVYCDSDPWQYFFEERKQTEKALPVGSVLTMVGTGSEMNATAVITNEALESKKGAGFGENQFPKFAVLNPKYTLTLPHYQMVSGAFDIMSHILEQYMSGDDDNTSDYLSEGLMRSVVHSSRAAAKNPQDYEARSNLMWSATWGLNTLLEKGKAEDWQVHAIGHAISALKNATHGMTLASVTIPYFRHIMDAGLHRFVRFAKVVWGVKDGMSDKETAEAGLREMEKWMREIGVVMNPREFGVTDEDVPHLAKITMIRGNGYKRLTVESLEHIFREAMKM